MTRAKAFTLPSTHRGWAVLYCRVMSLFAAQGAVLLTLHAARGFDTDPASMRLGLDLDPAHAVIHFVTGLQREAEENLFHLPLGIVAGLIAFAPPLRSTAAPSRP